MAVSVATASAITVVVVVVVAAVVVVVVETYSIRILFSRNMSRGKLVSLLYATLL